MKTYFGMKDFEGVGRVTVQCPGGEVKPLCDEAESGWVWGPDAGAGLAVHLMLDAGFGTKGYRALYNEKLCKLDPDASWTIDWYELKGFADAAGDDDA